MCRNVLYWKRHILVHHRSGVQQRYSCAANDSGKLPTHRRFDMQSSRSELMIHEAVDSLNGLHVYRMPTRRLVVDASRILLRVHRHEHEPRRATGATPLGERRLACGSWCGASAYIIRSCVDVGPGCRSPRVPHYPTGNTVHRTPPDDTRDVVAVSRSVRGNPPKLIRAEEWLTPNAQHYRAD